MNLLKRVLFLTVFIFIAILSSFSQMDMETHTIKKEQDVNGKTMFLYYNKSNKLIKKITLLEGINDGIRDGVTEKYIGDSLTDEFLRIVYVYKEGFVQEKSFYRKNDLLTLRDVYNRGVMISSLELVTNYTNDGKLHYIKKVYRTCNYMQYELINDVVIDSTNVRF